MLLGIDKNETVDFTSVQDKGEKKTIFKIGVLDSRFKVKVMSRMLDEKGVFDINKMQEESYEIFKLGVRGIENFKLKKDKKTEEINVIKISDDIMQAIPLIILTEVASKVIEFNFMSEQDVKN